MTKAASAGMLTALGVDPFDGALCFQVKYLNGTIFGGTEHNRSLTFDIGDGNGNVTYLPALGFSRSAIQSFNDFQPNNLTLEGAFDSVGITKADLRARKHIGATVKVFAINWSDLSNGIISFGAYLPGEVSVAAGFEIQLRGIVDRYSADIVELMTTACPVELGSNPLCRFQLDPPSWSASTAVIERRRREAQNFGGINHVKPLSFIDRHFICTTPGTTGGSEPTWNTTLDGTTPDGTAVWTTKRAMTLPLSVAGVTSPKIFTVNYTGDAPNELFRDGRATFTSGQNNSVKRAIKTWDLATKTVTLWRGFPLTIAINDNVNLSAGCNKDVPDCHNDFDNIFNHGGHPNVPSVWVIIDRP